MANGGHLTDDQKYYRHERPHPPNRDRDGYQSLAGIPGHGIWNMETEVGHMASFGMVPSRTPPFFINMHFLIS